MGDNTQHGTVLLEARAGLDRAGKFGLLATLLGCVLVIPVAFIENPDGGVTENLVIIGITYLIVAAVVVLTLMHLNSRFQVTETHVIKQRVLRPPLVIPRVEIAEAVVTRNYAVPRMGGPRAILLDRHGEALLTSHPLRKLSDVEALGRATPHVTHVDVLTPEVATDRWPRMIPWSHRSPKAALALACGIVAGIILVGVLAAVVLA